MPIGGSALSEFLFCSGLELYRRRFSRSIFNVENGAQLVFVDRLELVRQVLHLALGSFAGIKCLRQECFALCIPSFSAVVFRDTDPIWLACSGGVRIQWRIFRLVVYRLIPACALCKNSPAPVFIEQKTFRCRCLHLLFHPVVVPRDCDRPV